MLRLLCRPFHVGPGVDSPPPAQRCEARGAGAGASGDAQGYRSSLIDCWNLVGAHKHLSIDSHYAGALDGLKGTIHHSITAYVDSSSMQNVENTSRYALSSPIGHCVHMFSSNIGCVVVCCYLSQHTPSCGFLTLGLGLRPS